MKSLIKGLRLYIWNWLAVFAVCLISDLIIDKHTIVQANDIGELATRSFIIWNLVIIVKDTFNDKEKRNTHD